jgi:hypothetical protein
MAAGAKGRTKACDDREARDRLARAREFMEVAGLVVDEKDPQDHSFVYSNASGSLAVLAGIAASDAACCKALGKRSRGQSHDEAIGLIEQITPGGKEAGKSLRALLRLKDRAQYGAFALGGGDLKSLMRQSQRLVEFAEEVLKR